MYQAGVLESVNAAAGTGGIGLLLALIVVFSTVQGLFGVGLLVFGTPSLLLLGYSFQATLGCLLPCSLVISLMQVIQGREHIELKSSFGYALPPLVVGLVLHGSITVDIRVVVGALMILSVAVRVSERLRGRVKRVLHSHTRSYMMVMGAVHGVSNMGGALLTILAGSLFDSKESIRSNIAFCYLIFGVIQLSVLVLLHPQALTMASLVLATVALLTYLTLAKLIYLRTSEARYQALITIFMLCYGLILLGQKLLS